MNVSRSSMSGDLIIPSLARIGAGIGEGEGEGVEWVEGVVGGLISAGMVVRVSGCGVEVELYVVGLS